MNTIRTACLAILIVAGSVSTAFAQDNEAQVRKDLQAVLALKGKACGQITRLETLGENDYAVECDNGRKYRVRIDANDRVIIEDR